MTLTLSPETLTSQYGLVFEEGVDDLANYVLAALEHPMIGQIWLWKYEGSIDTDVIVDSQINAETARQIVMNVLELAVTDVSWVSRDDVES